jgi:glucose-6-phosphate 1-epimerase
MSNPSSDARHTEQIDFHGLPALRLRAPGGEALLYLHGGHVAAFRSARLGELLWTSAYAVYASGKAIRGGVPICFPWFGAHGERSDLPAHGFARTRAFRFEGSELDGDRVVARLSLESCAETRAAYPHDFVARLRVVVGAELEVGLEVENRGSEPLGYELALHTYLGVSDVRQISLRGLQGALYDDKVSGARGVVEPQEPLRLVGETDRVYQSTARVTVEDTGLGRRIHVDKRSSSTTVIWNPWIDKAKRMADFGDDEWPSMLCVEAANTGPHRVSLAPGERHLMSTTISTEPL